MVGANVLSASTLVTSGCPPADGTRTSFGAVSPGFQDSMSADCDVLFGSSNDTSTLRAYQPDNRGTAMSTTATTMTNAGSGNRMLDVDMATSNVGWAVGEGTASARLYKTTDGGDTWVAVADALDGLDNSAEGVDAVSTTVAWAARSNSNEVALTTDAASDTHAWAAGCEVVATRCRARIWRTANGGVDWTLAFSDNTVDSEIVEGVAISNTHAFAANTAGSVQGILETTDGVTFAATSGSTSAFRDVDSYDGVDVAAGTTGGLVHVSDDGGDTWTVRYPNVDASIRGVDYDSSGTIVIGMFDGSMARSTDDGATWATIDQDSQTGRIFAVDAVGSRIFASMNGASVVRSHDDGATWVLNSQATVANWSGIDGWDATRIWRVGGPGYIHVSVDGGLSWTNQPTGITEVLHGVQATSRTSAVAVGSDGTILRTTNSGAVWLPVTSPSTRTLLDIEAAPPPYDATLWASGQDNTLIRSTDRGATWSLVTGPVAANVSISAVAAWNERDVILGTTGPSSRVWTSTDGGANWTHRAAAGTIDGVMEIIVVPNTQSAVVLDDTSSRRTSDLGVTWASASIGSSNGVGGDIAPDGAIWITGEFNSSLVSTNNGASWTAWTGGPTSKLGMDAMALSATQAVLVADGNGTKTSDAPVGFPDYDGAGSSWTGSGFFGICLRAAPGTTSTWPTDGTCEEVNHVEWRAIPLNGGLATSSVATTLGSGTTTASFRFGMKVTTSQAAGNYVAPITLELTAPAG